MRSHLNYLAVLSAVTSTAFAHWNFDGLIVNGEVVGEPYQYVRKPNNSNNPLQNINSTGKLTPKSGTTDMRCNSGASSGLKTQTYNVSVGDKLGFTIADTFGHPGPQQVYLSKAPSTAAKYDGSGDQIKIYILTYSLNSNYGAIDGILKWATYRAQTFNFKLPEATLAGEYLLRAEGLALHAAHKANNAQFYVSCAQIRVNGSGEGVPGPTIKFPEGYQWNSPGVLIPEFWSKITNYTSPGPKLWPEGTEEQHVLDGKRKE